MAAVVHAKKILQDIGSHLPAPDWSGVNANMKLVAMADDVMMPPTSVRKLLAFYPEAKKTQLVLRPKDSGRSKLGHIAAFSEKNSAV